MQDNIKYLHYSLVLCIQYSLYYYRRTSQNLQSSPSSGKKTKSPNEEILDKRKVSFQTQKTTEEQIETVSEELYENEEITAIPNVYENYAKQVMFAALYRNALDRG